MLTRNGIAYNLKLSPYEVKVKYDKDSYVKYKFSSNLYKENFENKLLSNRDSISRSLSKRFGFIIVNEKLCDLKLYSSIEKRGFLIETKEGFIECLSTIKLDGQNKIQKK